MNKRFLNFIPALMMSCFITYIGFYSYASKPPKLIERKGSFLKFEEVPGYKNNKDYHILLEGDSKRYEIAQNGFMKDSFLWDVIYKDQLVLMVDEKDMKQPRNGWFGSEQRKNQVSTYEVRGPKKTYISKETSFASRKTNNQVLAPILGLLGLIGIVYSLRTFIKAN